MTQLSQDFSPFSSIEEWIDHWFYTVGINVLPQPTKSRDPNKFMIWQVWQNKPIPEVLFEQWKKEGKFTDSEGICLIPGRVWRGKYEGKYLAFIDLDNEKAISEFCTTPNRGLAPLQELAQKFIVEQHEDDPDRAHVYMYSDVPFELKSTGITQDNKEDFKQNKLPRIEVKGQGPHGIAFCSPSLHKYGYRYKILGTLIPEKVLTKEEAFDVMQHIDQICKKHGLSYLGENGKAQKIPVQELVKEGAVIMEGNNRHNGLVKMTMSLVSKLRSTWTLPDIKEMAFAVANPIHCKPPIDRHEFDRNVWRSVMRYLPPEQVYEDAANKAMQEIAAAAATATGGIDPTKILECSVSDVIQMNHGKGVVTTAKIIGVSPPYKMIKKATVKCSKCKCVIQEFDYDKTPVMSFKIPIKLSCQNKDGGELHTDFEHVTAKSITLQDTAMREDLDKLHVILQEDYTKNVRVGETATITGDVTVQNPSGLGGKKPAGVMYASHIKYEREEESPITEDDIALFKSFASDPKKNVIDELVGMFAPQVIGHSDAKLGILRSAVNVRETKHLTGIRSRTHTLLAGDPGTAKTILTNDATKIVPNSRYVTSQHMSIKSVLAIIEKEPDGSKMLMLGAVPQARNALCGINEIGSIVFEDQQHLADILEEGRFTIIKYGIYQEIDSPTTIIATTNPEGGYWNRSYGPPSLDQLPIKSNIRDRIDQTYIFEDFQTTEERREFAMRKMEMYQNPVEVEIDYDFLKRYLQYAASLPDPVLTPEAGTMLSDFWIRMTESGHASNRNFDSLVRIARGQARLHLKPEIDADIAREVMVDVQLMFVKMGRRIDPSIEDPRVLTYNQIIQYANTLQASITFIEAAKHVWATNNSVKQYLGGNNPKWSTGDNKRLRHVHDLFVDGAGVGMIKMGRGELAVTIERLVPLTITKAPKQEVKEESNSEMSGHDLNDHLTVTGEGQNKKAPSENGIVNTERSQKSSGQKVIWSSPNIVNEQSSREMSEIDQFDQFDHDQKDPNEKMPVYSTPNNTEKPQESTGQAVKLVKQSNSNIVNEESTNNEIITNQIIQRAMLDNQGNNKGYFTLDDLVFVMQMLPNERWTDNEIEQTLQALLQEGKVEEIEPAGSGRYRVVPSSSS